MQRPKAVLVIVLIIGLALIFPILVKGQSGVTVTDADSVLDTTYSFSSGLVDTTLTVNPRVAIEYAKTNKLNDLLALPTALQDLVNNVSPRVTVEYAKTNKLYVLVTIPTSLQNLVNTITARVAIEYARSAAPILINTLPTNLQNLLSSVAQRIRINYAASNHIAELIYPGGMPIPGGCTFSGTIDFQGRSDDSGATFTAGAYATTTNADGYYEIIVPEGTYDVTAEMDLYLDGERTGETCPAGGTNELTLVTLLGGDTNDDCTINILDLAFMGARYGLSDGDSGFDPEGRHQCGWIG